MTARGITISGLLLIIAGFAFAAAAKNPPKTSPGLRSNMPAGYDVMLLKPSRATLSLIGLIECPELEGAQRVSEGLHSTLVSADGDTIKEFPQHFSFRITASLRKVFLDGPVTSVELPDDPQKLLLTLKFRIRAYHGLEAREIVPQSIEMIGMPADVPYNERVYRINISTEKLPITDRLVVEIFSPEGELLTHFPFSLL
ncbi:MAG TPA: hypothetical protein VLA83_20315 [Candidatus Binatia bacterium]|nr:hypothetical protein [Candidatus Binatia bacterium]